jgi:hypothetical protein
VPGASSATLLTSSDLINWGPFQTVPLTNGSALFTDVLATNSAQRFYRLRVP